jgi:hypothetical protein
MLYDIIAGMGLGAVQFLRVATLDIPSNYPCTFSSTASIVWFECFLSSSRSPDESLESYSPHSPLAQSYSPHSSRDGYLSLHAYRHSLADCFVRLN